MPGLAFLFSIEPLPCGHHWLVIVVGNNAYCVRCGHIYRLPEEEPAVYAKVEEE